MLRLVAAALAVVSFTAACTPAATAPAGTGASVVIEVPEPDRVDWRRTVAGVEVAGVDTRPDPDELTMLERALRQLPSALLDVASPRRIYRVRAGTGDRDEAAYTIGPDVYLIDASFPPADDGYVTFDLVRLLAHELAHVAQYRALDDADLTDLPTDGEDPLGSTPLVEGFAASAGWRRTSSGGWALEDPAGTTPYGSTSPQEDMAEAVASTVAGSGPAVSPDRTEWVTRWLGVAADRLATPRPWAPEDAERFLSREPLYDTGAVAALGPGDVEVLTFGWPDDGPGDVAAEIERRLARRDVRGSFSPIADPRVARQGGTFTAPGGLRYHIELWDFRNAPGYVDPPDRLVVTYVVLWP